MTELPIVELHPASTWDCDNCGRENIARLLEVTDPEIVEQLQAARERIIGDGVEVEGDGFLAIPTTVTCKFCSQTYGADMFHRDDSDELDEADEEGSSSDFAGRPRGPLSTPSQRLCSWDSAGDETWVDDDDSLDEDDWDEDWDDEDELDDDEDAAW